MKVMKVKFLNLGLLFLAAVTTLSSCNDDINDYDYLVEGVGDIIEIGTSEYRILLDDADTVLVTNGVSFDFEEGNRVSFAGEIISTKENGDYKLHELRAVAMNSVLTKNAVLQSFIDEDFDNRTDSLGNDVISIAGVDVNKKYLNITFIISIGNNDISHFINLVHDDINTPLEVVDGVLTLDMDLRHNSNEDTVRYSAYGLLSVKLEDYVNLNGVEEIVFNIEYPQSSTSTVIKKVTLDLNEDEDSE